MPHGRTRLTIPRLREAPADVVRQLREISADAELVYMGEGRWLLGECRPSNTRLRLGVAALRRAANAVILHDDPPAVLERWRWVAIEGELLVQGFAPVKQFDVREPDSSVVEWYRRAGYWEQNALEGVLKGLEMDMDEADALAELREEQAAAAPYDDYRLKEAHRWGFKRPVSVTVNGRRDSALLS